MTSKVFEYIFPIANVGAVKRSVSGWTACKITARSANPAEKNFMSDAKNKSYLNHAHRSVNLSPRSDARNASRHY